MPALGVPGTTTQDMQRIIAAEYRTAGIIDGCDITTGSTMAYTISAGAVVLDTGADMAVKVPVAQQTIPTDPAPATGTRTDTIYVRQNFPTEANPDNSSFVGVTSGAAPSNAVVIDRRTVPAGATGTSATTSIHNRKFALPIGGSLGRLHLHINNDTSPRTTGVFTRGAGTFYVPTDRDVDVNLISTISAANSDGTTADDYGSVQYKIYLDGDHMITFERRYDRFWETKFFNFILAVSEGPHTIHYTVERSYVPSGGSGRWAVRHGGSDKFPGDAFRVYDRGVIHW